MLGRLLNNQSKPRTNSESFSHLDMSSSLPKSNLTKRLISVNSSTTEITPNYSNEDTLSRTVLYGTPNHLNSIQMDKNFFRLLVIQDQGDITQRNNYKTLFDTINYIGTKVLNFKNSHDNKELIEFMFGNPIYQDFNRSDHLKIHILSPLQDLKHSILITNHFYVTKKKRFAIGIVIPVSVSNFSKAILLNWSTITKYLKLLKLSYIDNHILNQQLGFTDILTLFKQFIKSINHLNSISRLLVGLIKFESVLHNWCFEVNNWIEIRDGGARLGSHNAISGTKFLTTLLTAINDVKKQLVSPNYKPNEMVRVVIMAANPIVAQKLIFIISGLLPFKLNFEIKQVHKIDSSESLSSSIPNQLTIPEDDVFETVQTPATPSVNSSKGWEIPKTPLRSVSTASITTPTNIFFQPTTSTLSTSSSMHYLSSSLSQSSTASTLSSSFSRGFQLLQSWKNSFDSNSSSSISSFHSMQLKTPSPAVEEYDEYPWTSNTTITNKNSFKSINSNYSHYSQTHYPQHSHNLHMFHHHHHHHLPRSNSYFDLATNNLTSGSPKLLKRQSIQRLPYIDRNTTSLLKIGSPKKTKSQLFNQSRKELSKMMSSSIEFELEKDLNKNVMVLDVLFDYSEVSSHSMIDEDETNGEVEHRNYTLPQLSGYFNEFLPEFKLQACPISQDLESRIVSTMKNDLKLLDDSKTILVSLRAREIQEISLKKRNQTEYKSHVKKVYSNGRPSCTLPKESFNKIDDLLQRVVLKFHNVEDDEVEDFKGIEELLECL